MHDKAIGSRKVYRPFSVGSQLLASGGNFAATLIISVEYGLDTLGIVMLYLLFANIAMSLQLNYFSTPLIIQYPKVQDGKKIQFINYAIFEYFVVLVALLLLILFIMQLGWRYIINYIVLVMIASMLISDFLKKILVTFRYAGTLLLHDLFLYPSLLMLLWIGADRSEVAIFSIYGCLFSMSAAVLALCVLIALFRLPHESEGGGESVVELNRARRKFGFDMMKSAVLQVLSGNGLVLIAATNLSTTALGIVRLAQSFASIFNPVVVYMETFFKAELAAEGSHQNSIKNALNWYLLLYPLIACIYGVAVVGFLEISAPEQMNLELVANVFGFLALTCFVGVSGLLRLGAQLDQNGVRVFRSYIASTVISLPMIWPLSLTLGSYGLILTLWCAQFGMIVYFSKASKIV